jgi:hypothetical protein
MPYLFAACDIYAALTAGRSACPKSKGAVKTGPGDCSNGHVDTLVDGQTARGIGKSLIQETTSVKPTNKPRVVFNLFVSLTIVVMAISANLWRH